MNAKQLGLGALLVVFGGVTAWAIGSHGYLGFFQTLLSTPAGVQAGMDLLIALSLVLVWMVRDARARGATIAPYLVLTLFLGSLGPLAYLIARERGSVLVAQHARP